MILSMNSQDLLEGLNTVTRALSPRPAKQILEGVLISGYSAGFITARELLFFMQRMVADR